MATVNLMLHPNVQLKDGIRNVVIRLNIGPKRYYINTGYNIHPDHWDPQKKKVLKLHDPGKYRQINKELKTLIVNSEQILLNTKHITKDRFVRLLKVHSEYITIDTRFSNKIKSLYAQGRIGYAKIFETTRNMLYEYENISNKYLEDIDPDFLRKFEVFMRKRKGVNDKQVSYNTISSYLRAFRTLFTDAIQDPEDNYNIELHPFKQYDRKNGYVIPGEKVVKRSIIKEDLKRIKDYPVQDLSSIKDAKLIFLFSFYTGGMNFHDICHLKWNNITEGILTYYRIKTERRQKIKSSIPIPLTEEAIEIIEYYKAFPNDTEYVFPIFNSRHITDEQKRTRVKTALKRINSDLRAIGENLNLGIPLTTYVARHSAAYLLKMEGVPTSHIKDILGHSSEKTTEIYLRSIDNNKAKEDLNKLRL